ncbi:MAG TPA: hypothetical protein DCE41_35070 [Cytophagales bacterium]|nr:hypothetical protein [Cytophagales bacterium]
MLLEIKKVYACERLNGKKRTPMFDLGKQKRGLLIAHKKTPPTGRVFRLETLQPTRNLNYVKE